ncbi:hypothetical protein [Deminuibacter soli]|uniref:DUF4468 domain-containing protein n=1 Tax=Deminuibacter soli TaxID=2291815 RepID=A0A3E1NHT0_9BACT|nr:hypothetical protein [Deminuibacter soli]RFM27457.1 hypothetical protein DXN05_15685 [Deminuibacter soli]
MKLIQGITVLAAVCFMLPAANAKDNTGLYMSAGDFETQALKYTDNYVIRTSPLFSPYKIKVLKAGDVTVLFKDDVYGYRDSKKQDYRFFNEAEYKIINTKGLYLYSRRTTTVKGKIRETHTQYYFSENASAPLKTLSIYHLKQAYPNNAALHDALDAQFRYDQDLAQYDNYQKHYKLVGLMERFVKQS